ncbi:MAG TPA: hypothetical protein VEV84_14765 [Pyrinomonadaceae bacterium]|nr:hypothetical protein [Pyrinomonadaceae bacterium]
MKVLKGWIPTATLALTLLFGAIVANAETGIQPLGITGIQPLGVISTLITAALTGIQPLG